MPNESIILTNEKEGILDIIGIAGVNWQQFLINLILAVLLIIAGVILGKIISVILKRIVEKTRVEKTAKYHFLDLIVTVVRWSVYILFLNLALEQMGSPALTKWLTSVLVVIPAFSGSLILIIIGFAIATYLKNLILNTKIEEWEVLAKVLFYFIMYIFLIFAFKTVLISVSDSLVNNLIMIWTVILAVAVAYIHIKR